MQFVLTLASEITKSHISRLGGKLDLPVVPEGRLGLKEISSWCALIKLLVHVFRENNYLKKGLEAERAGSYEMF